MARAEFQIFNNNDITEFSRLLGTHYGNGFKIKSSGMSMGSLGPVWWAIMIKESR